MTEPFTHSRPDHYTETEVADSIISSYLMRIRMELERALRKHPRPLKSLHEGHSVIREEFEEFWDEVKAQNLTAHSVELELVQTAAMCLRVLVELGPFGFKAQP